MARNISIDYGGYVISDIHGKIRLDKSFTSGSVEAEFLISPSSVSSMLAAIRKVRQATKVTISGNVLVDVKQSDFTGFDSAATAYKKGDLGDTGKTEIWTLRIEYGCPADVSSTSGLRSSSVNLSRDESGVGTVTISGVYTGLSGNNARVQYGAAISAYTTTVMTALGVAFYEKIGEPTIETNISNSLCNFSVTLRELIYSQSGFSYDDPEIVGQRITYSRNQPGPGDSPYQGKHVERLRRMTVRYEAAVNKALTTNLTSKWELIFVWLLKEAKRVLGASSIAIVDKTVDFNFDLNRISASIDIAGASVLDVIENRVDTEDYKVEGNVLVPIWTGPLDRYVYQGPAQVQRRITETFRMMGMSSLAPFADVAEGYNPANVPAPPGTLSAGAMQKKLISVRENRVPLAMGVFPDQFIIEEWRRETIIEFFNSVSLTIGGGGGGGGNLAPQLSLSR